MMGQKFDAEKDDWSLLPLAPIRAVIRVLMYGAVKYGRDNWMHVPNARNRYYSAALRHLTAWFEGEQHDKETGENHLAHALCCLTFLLGFDLLAEAPSQSEYSNRTNGQRAKSNHETS